MKKAFDRFSAIYGAEALERLSSCHIAVFGVGGVGGWAAEALARCGVGRFTLFDGDTVDITNINRQVVALSTTVGMYKTEIMKKRIEEINPDAQVIIHSVFYTKENSGDYPLDGYDYVIDAIDSVPDKLEIIKRAKECSVPVISAMGAAKKTDPSLFEVGDIYKTSVCPLAKVMRKRIREEGIDSLKVVFSKESPRESRTEGTLASVVFAVSGAGMMIAKEVIEDLASKNRK